MCAQVQAETSICEINQELHNIEASALTYYGEIDALKREQKMHAQSASTIAEVMRINGSFYSINDFKKLDPDALAFNSYHRYREMVCDDDIDERLFRLRELAQNWDKLINLAVGSTVRVSDLSAEQNLAAEYVKKMGIKDLSYPKDAVNRLMSGRGKLLPQTNHPYSFSFSFKPDRETRHKNKTRLNHCYGIQVIDSIGRQLVDFIIEN